MASSFIQARDADALLSMRAFSDGISANPALYQVNAIDAATIATAVNQFGTALGLTSSPATRTRQTLIQKDQCRNAAEGVCRQYANLIKYNAGISDEDKAAIGIEPVNPSRNPRECPQASPAVLIVASTQGAQTLQYRNSIDPESRGKPFGATELLLFVAISEENETDPEAAKFYGKFTKNPMLVEFSAADNGKQATYFARWAGKRGDMSMWSTPVSLAIAA